MEITEPEVLLSKKIEWKESASQCHTQMAEFEKLHPSRKRDQKRASSIGALIHAEKYREKQQGKRERRAGLVMGTWGTRKIRSRARSYHL